MQDGLFWPPPLRCSKRETEGFLWPPPPHHPSLVRLREGDFSAKRRDSPHSPGCPRQEGQPLLHPFPHEEGGSLRTTYAHSFFYFWPIFTDYPRFQRGKGVFISHHHTRKRARFRGFTAANVCCQHDVTNDDNALPTPTMMKDAAAAPAVVEDNTIAATAAAAAT
jgi:hypothetical protein